MASAQLVYADTSALVKLVLAERETPALLAWLRPRTRALITSDLTRTELLRAARRGDPATAPRARAILEHIDVMMLSTPDFDRAATLDPPALRTLDALHLAAALSLGDDLRGMLAYDDLLADAAAAHGIRVFHPGAR